MKHLTQMGKTVEEAIEKALEQLNKSRDEVTVRIIDEGKKGFFGFGARDAEVEVTVMETAQPAAEHAALQTEKAPSAHDGEPSEEEIAAEMPSAPTEEGEEPNFGEPVAEPVAKPSNEKAIEETKAYLQDIAQGMKIDDLSVLHEKQGKTVRFKLESEKVAMLIGKRGQTLNSLQQLAQLVANRHAEQFMMVELDAENYRERRQETLEQLADRMADKAIRTGNRVQFEPMPSYERKVIHQALSRRFDIDTYSEGKDPNRYLVIEPHK
ncbi:protein jag [Planococcus maritimus]|uniref:RNA-binding cell elongation regulator Jag/EloR n=1 Tax=Planococcus maritimus TaxID=192421 RepID=UPI00080F149B|nr:RNA-binding cell elongation regulator Jag/EloR [Planococcus maritimus]ANU15721.1 protein jag [Planococcus maritimus]